MLNSVMEKVFKIRTVHEDIRAFLGMIDELHLDHIHFGCWLNSNDSFVQAQENLYNLVRAQIPEGVRDILDIGGGVGNVSARLLRDHFNVICVVPDPALIRAGRKRFPEVVFHQGTAEFFNLRQKFNLALLIESYQYFTAPKRALLNIDRHLNANGYILLADEFWANDAIKNILLEFCKIKNYHVVQQLELTKAVIPSCDFFLDYFRNKGERYVRRWQHNKEIYLAGEKNYFIYLLQKQNR